MGHFYTNILLRGVEVKTVAKHFYDLNRYAAVSPQIGDYVAVFDRKAEAQNESGFRLAQRLSKHFECIAWAAMNHDDSVLFLRLYSNGKLIDRYNSCPNYFDGQPVPPSGGDATKICEAFDRPREKNRVAAILNYDSLAGENDESPKYVWEVERHRDLLKALKLPLFLAGTGYTYLAEDRIPKGSAAYNSYSVIPRKAKR